MLKDVLAMTAAIVILTVGTASAFWDVVFFGQKVAGATTAAPKPAPAERATATTIGSVKVIDTEDSTLTLVSPPALTLTLVVHDPQLLDGLRVGDPVAVTYYEALVIQLEPAGAATSVPDDLDARRSARPVTFIAGIAGVDGKRGTLTIKRLRGALETMKVRDARTLTGVRAGDLVQLTFMPAVVVSLEKSAGM